MLVFLFNHHKYLCILFIIFLLPCFSYSQKKKLREIEYFERNNQKIKGITKIIIDKSDYFLRVYDEVGLFARYPVVFGNDVDKDKFKEGDKRTPEGTFIIQYIQPHHKWHVIMMLDYPNKESVKKFEQRKKECDIKVTDKIGGAIGIHGTWPKESYLIDKYRNWTDGCISLKNEHIDDLRKYVVKGTVVEIQK